MTSARRIALRVAAATLLILAAPASVHTPPADKIVGKPAGTAFPSTTPTVAPASGVPTVPGELTKAGVRLKDDQVAALCFVNPNKNAPVPFETLNSNVVYSGSELPRSSGRIESSPGKKSNS